MTTLLLPILGGAAAALTLDTIGSIAAKRSSFSYARLAPVSSAIYSATGALAGHTGGTAAAFFAGAVVGLVDSTIGWRISWVIGPGRWPDDRVTATRVVGTSLRVTLLAGVLGMMASVLASAVLSVI